MYIPRQYSMSDERLQRFLDEAEAGQLVTATANGLQATLLPLVFRRREDGSGSFVAHMARVNPQWQLPALGEALLILHGPEGYVGTEWMPDVREAGTAIATWNYLTVHVYGNLIVHDDPQWAWDAADELARRYEPDYDIEALPEPYKTGQKRAIVGIELEVVRCEGKAKLSQNRSVGDLETIVAGLRETGSDAMADEVENIACPYAAMRDDAVTAAAQRRAAGLSQ